MITKNWCLVATTHEIPSHNIPTFFFSSLRLSQHIAWYASSLPTCKRIYPGLIEEFSTLTEEREWYNWIPRCPMGSLPFSYSLSQSFSRQLAATKHGVHPDQGNPRSGACVCAYCLVFPGPPPSRKYILRNKPGMEIWILVRGVSAATYLSVLPAYTACSTDPRHICFLFSFVYILYILLVSHCAVLIPTSYFFYFGYNYRIFILDRNS